MKLKRKIREAPLPYVPMADLAFNLLIFFLVLAKSQQDTLTWEKASSPGTSEMLSTKLVVTITKGTTEQESKIYLNGAPIGTRDLSTDLEYLLGDSPPDKRKVLLKIDKNAPPALYKPVLEAVSKAGAEVFHVLDEEK